MQFDKENVFYWSYYYCFDYSKAKDVIGSFVSRSLAVWAFLILSHQRFNEMSKIREPKIR